MKKGIKKVKINDETVEIKKLNIVQAADLLLAVEDLPGKFQNVISLDELSNFSNELIFSKVPTLIASMQDDFFNLVSVASGIDIDEIKQLDFEEFLDVLTAVLELNNLKAIINKVKNLGKFLA